MLNSTQTKMYRDAKSCISTSPEIPVTGFKKFRQVVGGLMIMALFGYGIVSGLTWLFTPSEPTIIKEISSHIISADEVTKDGKKLLKIELKTPSALNESSYFFSTTNEAMEILAKTVKYFPNQQADQIEFILIAELSDNYGNASNQPVIGLTFDTADIKKINFAHFTSWDLLRFAGLPDYLHPAGRKIVNAYCQDETNKKYAIGFCQAATIQQGLYLLGR